MSEKERTVQSSGYQEAARIAARKESDPMVPNKDSLYRTGPLNMDQVGELETLLREGALVRVGETDE